MGMNPKPMLQSKTIIGALLMAVTLVAQFYQAPVSQEEINQAGNLLEETVKAVSALVGFTLVIYGRFKAVQPVNILGK